MATKLEIYNEALRLVGDLRLVSLTDDVEARYALDDAWRRSVLFCGSQADWAFAITDISAALVNENFLGYTKSFTFDPNVWLRTVAVSFDTHFAIPAHYQQTATKFRFSTSAGTAYFRYVSKALLEDSTVANWPEMFSTLVAHRVAFEVCERLTQDPQKARGIYQLFVEVLGLAKSQLAPETGEMMVAPSQWAAKVHNDVIGGIWEEAMRLMGTGDPKKPMLNRAADGTHLHQIMEMAWRRVPEYVLGEGYWNFATRVQGFSTSAGSAHGYSYSYTKPANWIRTVSVAAGADTSFSNPVEYRDEMGRWFVNEASIIVRFISNEYTVDSAASTWPDNFKRALACRLAYECVDIVTGVPDKRQLLEKEYAVVIARALAQDAANGTLAIPRRRNPTISSMWSDALRLMGYSEGAKSTGENELDAERVYQILNGAWDRVVGFCLTEHQWNFATTTAGINASGAATLGFNFGFTKPSNWLRTLHVSSDANFSSLVAYRDEGGRFFANVNPIYVRYVSSTPSADGSAPAWPETFKRVVSCRLALECVDSVTKDPNRRSVLEAAYTAQLDSSKKKDAEDQSLVVPQRRGAVIGGIWSESLRLIGYMETARSGPDKDIEAIYRLLDDAWDKVVNLCLTEALWNFATTTVSVATSGATIAGYTFGFAKPAGWSRTVSISNDASFKTSIEYRDEGGRFYANVSPIFIRYTSSSAASDASASSWPESFRRLLAVRLAHDCVEAVMGDPNKRTALAEMYAQALASASEKDASDNDLFIPKRRAAVVNSIWEEALRLTGYPESRKSGAESKLDGEAVYQILESAWPRVVNFCLTEGYWNFATSVASIAASGTASLGFTHGFSKPNDWVRTIHIASDNAFSTNIEYRDQGGRLFANGTPIFLRYISSSLANDGSSALWPEIFNRVTAYRLAYECVEAITGDPNRRAPLLEEYKAVLAEALAKDAADQSLLIPKRRNATISAIWKEAARLVGYPETRKATAENEIGIESVYQLFNDSWVRVVRYCLTEALWNFATKTIQISQSGAPVPGWQYAFNKPNGWLRTIAVSNTSEFYAEARYHDEGGKLYANDPALFIRYISSEYSGDDIAPNWPEMFCRVLAYRLAYECSDAVTNDPNRAAKLLADYKAVLSQAKSKDAMDQAQMYPKVSNWLGGMRGGGGRRYDRGPLSGY